MDTFLALYYFIFSCPKPAYYRQEIKPVIFIFHYLSRLRGTKEQQIFAFRALKSKKFLYTIGMKPGFARGKQGINK